MKFLSLLFQVKQIEKRDSVLTSKNQIERLTRPGSSYFNLNPFEVSCLMLWPADGELCIVGSRLTSEHMPNLYRSWSPEQLLRLIYKDIWPQLDTIAKDGITIMLFKIAVHNHQRQVQGKLNLDIGEVKMVYVIRGPLIYTVFCLFVFPMVSLKAFSFPMGVREVHAG